MVLSCCVKNCPSILDNKTKSDISFHRFPVSQPKLIEKWLEFLNYGPEWVQAKYATICSNHFKPTDYRDHTKNRRLKINAYPTLLGKDELEKIGKQKKKDKLLIEMDKTLPTKNLEDSEFCRLCGLEHFYRLTSIFATGSNYARQIEDVFHLKVLPSDMLPVSICEKCKVKLRCIVEFTNDVKNAQQILADKLCNKSHCNNLQNISEFKNVSKQLNVIDSENVLQQNHLKQMTNTHVPIAGHHFENDRFLLKTDTLTNGSLLPSKPVVMETFLLQNHSTELFPEASVKNMSKPFDNLILKTKIKQEVITGNTENNTCNISHRNPSKRIEILEDIKLAPSLNKIAYKSFKSIYDESILNRKSICHTVPAASNALNLKVVDTQKLCKTPKSGEPFCHLCKTNFISKYALNHHKKHVCKFRANIFKEKVFVRKRIPKKKLIKVKNVVNTDGKEEVPLVVPVRIFKNRRKPEIKIKQEYD